MLTRGYGDYSGRQLTQGTDFGSAFFVSVPMARLGPQAERRPAQSAE